VTASRNLVEVALNWVSASLPEDNRQRALWMDAATGAGNATLRLAERLQGKGQLVTVDVDPESWTDWTRPKLEKAGLLDVVRFEKLDLADLSNLRERFDGIFSDMTLSTMGLAAVEAVAEWRRVLKPGGCVIVRDYLPQGEARNQDERITNLAWRLYKATEVLSGQPHYEEIPPEFWERRFTELGFRVEALEVDPQRPPRSQESLDEWLSLPLEPDVDDAELRDALIRVSERLKDAVRTMRSMTRWSGDFILLATWPP